MNEKEPHFSPVFYILLPFLFSCPAPLSRIISTRCGNVRRGMVVRWSLCDGELSERTAFSYFFFVNGTSCMILS
jgi:hypothetical protein